MSRLSALHFYPERIVWIGLCVLGFGLFLVFPSLFLMEAIESPYIVHKSRAPVKRAQFSAFSLGLSDQAPVLPLPDLKGAMTFSFDPPRPDQANGGKRLMVRIQNSLEARKVFLPCRLDLAFIGKTLVFAGENSPLWIELSLNDQDMIENQVFVRTVDGDQVIAGNFLIKAGETPIQSAHELSMDAPFRALAECKWWGKDQFRIDSSGERLEFSTGNLLELKTEDWLVFQDGVWQKLKTLDKELPIARIQLNAHNALILEGWDSNGHVRLNVPLAMGPPLKFKPEELFSSVRVRSEKQISCMMEKQCLVLKLSDWVLKAGPRWKVLRKKEDKDAYLNGQILGELFVLDQIAQKQGQKVIQGRLFNQGKTQMQNVELAATGNRKNSTNRRGKK